MITFFQSSFETWTELQVEEPIVGFVFDTHSNCLIMRSGLGHLFGLGSLNNMFETHSNKHGASSRVRKIRIPNKRKCTNITGCGKCLFG